MKDKGTNKVLDILQFIFSDFFIWLGTMILTCIVVEGIVKIFEAVFRK